MSRVEPAPQKRSYEARRHEPRRPVDRHPSQAEGDEQTVKEALRNDERRRD